MTIISDKSRLFLLLLIFCFTLSCASQPPRPLAEKKISLIQVTPDVTEYAYSTVKPVIASHPEKDRLSLLLKVSEILNDPVTGIGKNKIAPDDFMIYDMLSKIKLDFLVTVKLSPEQKQILELWHSRYMGENPADVFFAPPAGEIIRQKQPLAAPIMPEHSLRLSKRSTSLMSRKICVMPSPANRMTTTRL